MSIILPIDSLICVLYTAHISLMGNFMLTQGSFSTARALREALRSGVESSKLSKQEIAERAGISRRALYSLLEGEVDPRLSTLESLAHVLGMDLFAAPKAAQAMKLSSPTEGALSQHSRVRRLLEELKPRDASH
ncbi:MAG: helix-turn-helix transcriptional regulator [Burkholderiaceae bacterium]